MIFIACSRTARQESGCVHVALEYMDTCTAGCAMSQRALKGPSHVQCVLKVARSADRAGFAFCDFLQTEILTSPSHPASCSEGLWKLG